MRRLILAFLTTALVTSTGCSAMTATQCLGKDWYTLGYADAASGQGTQRFLAYHNSCVQHGIPPNRTRYLSGWSDGREAIPQS